MGASTGLLSYAGEVLPEWIDRNAHMSTPNYLAVGHEGMKALFVAAGLGGSEAVSGLGAFFQGETHTRFERELKLASPIAVHSWIVGQSPRWVHQYHEIWESQAAYRAATIEIMTVHVDPQSRRAIAMPAAAVERLLAFMAAHPPPEHALIGRRVGDPAPGRERTKPATPQLELE